MNKIIFSIRNLWIRHKYLLLCIGIVAIGMWLRFFDIFLWSWKAVAYDESRDVLVARHIGELGEHISRGPLAAGSNDVLKNSPFYYYFLGFLWSVTRSPYGMLVLWVMILSTMIYFAYKIGTSIWDKTLGIYAALFFAFHPHLVFQVKQFSQLALVPFWSLLCLFVLMLHMKRTVRYLIIALVILFTGLHIHLSALIILPVFFIWFCWDWKYHKRKAGWLILWVLPVLITEYILLVWVYTTYAYTPFDQTRFFFQNAAMPHVSISNMFISVWELVAQTLFRGMNTAPAFWMAWTMLFVVGYQWIKQKRHGPVSKHVMWLLVSFIVPPLFAMLYRGELIDNYLLPVLPVGIVIIALLVRFIHSQNKILACILAMIVATLWIQETLLTKAPSQSYLSQHEYIAKKIAADYDAMGSRDIQGLPAFTLATMSSNSFLVFDGWGTSSSWYWLEHIYNRPLVRLEPYGSNFYPLIEQPKYFYMICDHREGTSGQDVCLDRFILARSYLGKDYKKIHESDRLSAWRFDVIGIPKGGSYNAVYSELLTPAKYIH